jgi:hypothetical protein
MERKEQHKLQIHITHGERLVPRGTESKDIGSNRRSSLDPHTAPDLAASLPMGESTSSPLDEKKKKREDPRLDGVQILYGRPDIGTSLKEEAAASQGRGCIAVYGSF